MTRNSVLRPFVTVKSIVDFCCNQAALLLSTYNEQCGIDLMILLYTEQLLTIEDIITQIIQEDTDAMGVVLAIWRQVYSSELFETLAKSEHTDLVVNVLSKFWPTKSMVQHLYQKNPSTLFALLDDSPRTDFLKEVI